MILSLIKVDVEGAEEDVLDGMSKIIQRSTDLRLIIEYNPGELKNAGKNPFLFFEKLDALGFQIEMIDESKGLEPLDPFDCNSLVTNLLGSGATVNLFCSQKLKRKN